MWRMYKMNGMNGNLLNANLNIQCESKVCERKYTNEKDRFSAKADLQYGMSHHHSSLTWLWMVWWKKYIRERMGKNAANSPIFCRRHPQILTTQTSSNLPPPPPTPSTSASKDFRPFLVSVTILFFCILKCLFHLHLLFMRLKMSFIYIYYA